MEDKLIYFLEGCGDLPLILKYLIVAGIGFLPIIEIRGAVVAGVCALGLGAAETYIFALMGNVLLAFPVVILGSKIVRRLEATRALGWFGRWMERRTAGKIEKVRTATGIGLFLFVAVPVPGTGVFTAGLIASFLSLRMREAFLSLAAGAAVAGAASFLIYALPLYASMYSSAAIPWFR